MLLVELPEVSPPDPVVPELPLSVGALVPDDPPELELSCSVDESLSLGPLDVDGSSGVRTHSPLAVVQPDGASGTLSWASAMLAGSRAPVTAIAAKMCLIDMLCLLSHIVLNPNQAEREGLPPLPRWPC